MQHTMYLNMYDTGVLGLSQVPPGSQNAFTGGADGSVEETLSVPVGRIGHLIGKAPRSGVVPTMKLWVTPLVPGLIGEMAYSMGIPTMTDFLRRKCTGKPHIWLIDPLFCKCFLKPIQ
jgi:hypothetical protein